MQQATDKTALRRELQRRRASLGTSSRQEKSRQILSKLYRLPEFSAAQRVFCFISHGTEVDTHTLINSLLEDGKTVAVPKITENREMIAVPFKDWAGLVAGQLGILTPVSSREYPGKFDLCITPGLGFTETGTRLGYGRGYYDRWFAGNECGCRIALAFECQVLNHIAREEHDVAVDIILTEDRVLRVA